MSRERTARFTFSSTPLLDSTSFNPAPLPRTSIASRISRSVSVPRSFKAPCIALRFAKSLPDCMYAFRRHKQYMTVIRSRSPRQRGNGSSSLSCAPPSLTPPCSATSHNGDGYSSSSRDKMHVTHSRYEKGTWRAKPNTPSPYGNAFGSNDVQKSGSNMSIILLDLEAAKTPSASVTVPPVSLFSPASALSAPAPFNRPDEILPGGCFVGWTAC